MKQPYLLVLFVFLHPILHGQSKTDKPALHFINSIGMTDGSKGVGFLLQSVPGFSWRRSFAGIGIGIDDYNLRSVPLFLDLRQEFGRKSRHMFLYADGGYNFDWLTEKDGREQQQFYSSNNFYGGIYCDAGIGYSIHLKSKDVFLISAGYTYKQLHDKVSYTVCTPGSCYLQPATITYRMPRLSVKAGWRF